MGTQHRRRYDFYGDMHDHAHSCMKATTDVYGYDGMEFRCIDVVVLYPWNHFTIYILYILLSMIHSPNAFAFMLFRVLSNTEA